MGIIVFLNYCMQIFILLVITNLPKPLECSWYPSVSELAKQNNIDVLETNDLKKDYEVLHRLSDLDLIVCSSYRNIIPRTGFDLPKFGAINLHMAPLPK